MDFAAHWLETHTGPHLAGGLLAVLLEVKLESGVGQAGLTFLHFSHFCLKKGEKAGWSSAEEVTYQSANVAPAWKSEG